MMRKFGWLAALGLCVGLGAVGYMALSLQNKGGQHGGHSAMAGGTMPQEGGQDAFTAIAEIVQVLSDDPKTDWSKVNIDALRAHLLDMDNLTTKANVTMRQEGETITYTITGPQDALEAAKRMVPAHSAELKQSLGWQIEALVEPASVQMVVSPTPNIPLAKIKGLGFFGIMATGSHHQPHHLGMASGAMVH